MTAHSSLLHPPTSAAALSPVQKRWALWILCLGTLMIVLDTTIVNVALPAIQNDLGFSAAELAWVVNAYMLSFGGCLMLGGRLGDLYGQKPLFLGSMVLFILASLACGWAPTQELLITARALQGMGGAVVDAVALAMLMQIYTDPQERTRAMGIFGFVAAGGGALGVMAGGILVQTLGWPWIFWVNVPIGALVLLLGLAYLPSSQRQKVRLDLWGALSMTAGLLLLVYAVIHTQSAGWLSLQTLATIAAGVLVLLMFAVWERRLESRQAMPLMPLSLLRGNNLAVAGGIGMLWAAAMFAWFFLAALYLQQVLNYSPLEIGLAFLPANLIMAAFSISLSARLVMRWGNAKTLGIGMGIVAVSLGLCAYTTGHITQAADHIFWRDVFPSMCLLGMGCGMAMNPIMMSAMDGVAERDAGLASGIVNTAFMAGGALGLAILASWAGMHTARFEGLGLPHPTALAKGYEAAFILSTAASILATFLAFRRIKNRVLPAQAADGKPL